SRKLCATGRSSTAMASARTQRTTWCAPGRSRVRSMAGSTRAGSARQDDLRLLAVAAVARGTGADALHHLGPAAARHFGDGGVAGLPLLGGDLHLDPFVVLQGTSHFRHHGTGQALGAEQHHRLQRVGERAQVALLGGGQRGGHGQRVAGGPGVRRVSCRPASTLQSMARSKSSQRWLKEHFADPFVKRAQSEGLRSRAAYKLEELLAKDRVLKPGMVVVDLGAAPGGWSQVVRRELGDSGRVIALDILEMPPIAGVEFIHGDFREDSALSTLEAALDGQAVDLVLSDMAPNMTGMD